MVTTIFIHIYFTASNAENLACTVPTTAWGMYLLPFYVSFTATWATSSWSLLTYCNCCCCFCYSYIVICLWLVCPVLHSTPTDPDIICRPCWIDERLVGGCLCGWYVWCLEDVSCCCAVAVPFSLIRSTFIVEWYPQCTDTRAHGMAK